MTREELINLVQIILNKIEKTETMQREELRRVGGMTEAELQNMIRVLLEESSVRQQQVARHSGGFGKFLQVIGVGALGIVSIIILSVMFG